MPLQKQQHFFSKQVFKMKGVSAFLAAVLIISIVLVVAVIFSTWTTGLFKTETVKTENRTGCQGSDLSIEGVYVDGNITGNKTRIVVRNSGFNAESIQSAIVLNQKGESLPNLTQFPISLAKGAITPIEFKNNNTATTYYIGKCSDFSLATASSPCAEGSFDSSKGQTPVCSGF